MIILNLIKMMRPKDYLKNIFVLSPLIYSKLLNNFDKLQICFIGFILFCLVSGCVYIINDITDIKIDKIFHKTNFFYNYLIRTFYVLLFMGFLFIGMGEGVNNKLLSLIDFLFNGLIPSFDYWIQERIWIGGLIIYLTSLFMMK